MTRTRNVDAAGAGIRKQAWQPLRACPSPPDTYVRNCLDSDRARKKKSGNTSRAGVAKTAVTWEADSQGEIPRARHQPKRRTM